MLVALKTLNVKNLKVHTKWRTTDSWLGVARLILSLTLSLTLLKRLLQLVHLVLTLSSV